jgi:membrane associated rhomboid family serine protease
MRRGDGVFYFWPTKTLCSAKPSPILFAMSHSSAEPTSLTSPIPQRFRRALNISLGFIALLFGCFYFQQHIAYQVLSLQPSKLIGLIGIITAPLLHGSFEHLFSNSFSILILGTLVGTVYPKASVRALPIIWILSGVGTWFIAMRGFHIGASGITHGLMFFLMTMGLLRRDRPAIAAAFIGILLFGGMLLSVLPQQPDVSWEYHLSGALAGIVCAIIWRKLDPGPPSPIYSWDEEEASAESADDESLELPRPQAVPVLWHRPSQPRSVVLLFRQPPNNENAASKDP